ncbi:flagellar assembly protein FliH (plasmid) [Rossellomorea sp. AcN35-11]|nr:flagellar assembly protein FliH [Rossellomorea aquimaris]WJV32281.1 flagellar assembly protein FliH [Rossellomorea sp. AcN35-11]
MSNIIKSPNASSVYIIKHPEEPSPVIENDLPSEYTEGEIAESIIQKATQTGDMIILEAENKKQQLEKQLKQQKEQWAEEKLKIEESVKQIGYQEGYGEGKRAALQEYTETLSEIKDVLTRTVEQHEKVLEEMEPQLLEASLRIASKILGQTIEEDPNRFLSIVQRVVREVKEENDIKVYIHPSYFEMVFNQKEDLKALLQQEAMLTIYADETLDETHCIVESSYGRIEGGIDDQLQQIKQALSKCLEKG